MDCKPVAFKRRRALQDRLAIRSANTVDAHVARGILTKPIRLSDGPTTPLVWPESEIEEIVAARVRGECDEQIRALVIRLEAARHTTTPGAGRAGVVNPSGADGAAQIEAPAHEADDMRR
jgi:hypothetical protein